MIAAPTPGPWSVETFESFGQGEWHGWSIKGAHGVITSIGAASQRGPIDMESNRANAYLIAAAPIMLDTLRAVRNQGDLPSSLAERIDAALSAATADHLKPIK